MTDRPQPSLIRRQDLREATCDPARLLAAFGQVRGYSEALAAPLATEDMVVQTMPDVSPTKWHLAHTTWFFQTFVLDQASWPYSRPNPQFAYLFNSYYEQVGAQFPRPQRGLITRPTVAEVMDYRAAIDRAIEEMLQQADEATWQKVRDVLILGLHHEQQHQELMLTDIKHVLFANPLRPAAYRPAATAAATPAATIGSLADPQGGEAEDALAFCEFSGGINRIGATAPGGGQADAFCFDCELPCHQVLLTDFALATRPVTNGEFLAFVEAGGYQRPEFWAADGWATVRNENWRHPLYWENCDGQWQEFSLYGMQSLCPDAAVCHLSWYEAQACANFNGCRLPLEAELEIALALDHAEDATECRYHPGAISPTAALQPAGVWEWTGSAFLPYPGYTATEGALGEYNGKFMSGQMVLKGGSCLTPAGHIRSSYRNFFPPAARWQMSGVRLARDV